ncbi:DUF4091 domain-containing protein [Paenibacillus montanisoli]|uniref:Glycoside hydrolase 123 catalytic domain-containing protein n=1 Tax=Paenibacillus montanisoli TaxID=2081970 RepID=A0A328TT98_9BACL|nr:DUF4091 domain-containing protein [Paenibacillus montanisoli]RAP73819.1 hypothetical protein DL346_26570 [Paenibacillus montanisoli]
MDYQVFSMNEWIYPDSVVSGREGKEIRLSSARGSYAACQLLFNTPVEAPIHCEFIEADGSGFALQPEVYRLIDIFVEKNTGPVNHCVAEGESAEGYTTRPAPFRVYEAMRPLAPDVITRAATEALYVCWRIAEDAKPGRYSGVLAVTIGEQSCRIPVKLELFSAVVPAKETLAITNWFSLPNMAKRYGVELWSEGHWEMIEKYGKLMRRARQTHFWVPMDAIQISLAGEDRYEFNFERAERLIRLYFSLGFTHIEGGLVAGRKDFWGSEFFIWNTWNGGDALKAISTEGYAYLSQFLPAWRSFLEQNGWLDVLVQHVADEPIGESVEEYRILSGIVRKFMPGIPLLEAVETHDLSGAVDILVPKNVYYLEHQEKFEKLRSLGDKLWFYTCCFPGGKSMNRLWDMPLLRTRYLHWGNYKYDLEGFLHWGLNHCDDDKDPYEQTDLFFPPGDTHITFPGPNGPLGSVRLEAMRAGIEDYELLKQLAAKDKALADELTDSCLMSFNEANEDPAHFGQVHRKLLAALSEEV